MQAATDSTMSDTDTADERKLDELVDTELRKLCLDGWQLHRELAAMQAALRAANLHRPLLPVGLEPRPVIPRVLAVPFVPCGSYHQLLVTPEYAFACSGAKRVEELQYDEMQHGLRRQLRETTERTLLIQKVEARNSHTTQQHMHSPHAAATGKT